MTVTYMSNKPHELRSPGVAGDTGFFSIFAHDDEFGGPSITMTAFESTDQEKNDAVTLFLTIGQAQELQAELAKAVQSSLDAMSVAGAHKRYSDEDSLVPLLAASIAAEEAKR